jgi:hypothetical protein
MLEKKKKKVNMSPLSPRHRVVDIQLYSFLTLAVGGTE